MLPRFKTVYDWEQAQILMQPCLIRVLDNIRKQLDESPYQGTYQEVTEPIPGHELCLTYQETEVIVNIWELCFQVCFLNYEPSSSKKVEIDPTLLDETGEVDWQTLDDKTQSIINKIFLNLQQSHVIYDP